MGSLLTADLYPKVRAALDLSLDAISLPDEVIDLFAEEAEEEVTTLDTAAATYDPVTDVLKFRRATRAVAYLTASRLALQIPALTSEQLIDDRYQRVAFDGKAMFAQLRSLGLAQIDLNTGGTGETTPLFSFGLAHGYRGR